MLLLRYDTLRTDCYTFKHLVNLFKSLRNVIGWHMETKSHVLLCSHGAKLVVITISSTAVRHRLYQWICKVNQRTEQFGKDTFTPRQCQDFAAAWSR
jgi:hypothetical protein